MSDTDRLELPDGQWADIKRRASFGDFRAIDRVRMTTAGTADQMDIMRVTLTQLVTDWHVLGPAGKPVPLDATGIEQAPMDLIFVIYERCGDVLAAAGPKENVSPNP